MEHIRQFDWCSMEPDIYFLNESELDNCVTERILRNKFRDPMISSDEEETPKIDWNEVFKQKDTADRPKRIFVPGIRPVPQFPKMSALTYKQHCHVLKVLCSQNPHILPTEFMPRPTKQDYKVFEEVKEIYAKEQQEYIEWAKTMWTNHHCVRALRPKQIIEMVYEAEFKIKANELNSFPKTMEMAAQIPLETRDDSFEMIHDKDLISINVSDLPKIECPDLTKKCTVIRPCSTPEPCNKHPCKFILPREKSISILPLTEVQRELAQFALENGCSYIASEKALRCLVEQDRLWTLPISVCQVIGPDGDKSNIVVLGSECPLRRAPAQTRTYRALAHLLELALVPSSERVKVLNRMANDSKESIENDVTKDVDHSMDFNSSDDEDNLFIDAEIDDSSQMTIDSESQPLSVYAKEHKNKNSPEKSPKKPEKEKCKQEDEFYVCTCEESVYVPPPRSYSKWMVKSKATHDQYNFIVHCAHKVRDKSGEVILEPIPEYQLELGACKQCPYRVKSLALSLMLRNNASLMNVRLDAQTGDVVSMCSSTLEEHIKEHGDVISDVSNTIYTALSQLQGLLPGNYVLHHEPTHGSNVLLYAWGLPPSATLPLRAPPAAPDDAPALRAPVLGTGLLPYHKFRRILPCAFTTTETQVAKEPKKPITRQKTPPQAIKWPKRRLRKRKNNAN